jgi:hypothetical protein
MPGTWTSRERFESVRDSKAALEDRRNGVRYPAHEQAMLTHINPADAGRFSVLICDVSEKGMQLRVPEYICPGTMVQIRLARLIVTAEVRYCRADCDEFRAGLKVVELLSRTGKFEGLL